MPLRSDELMTPDLERALRWAAVAHRGQSRKGGDIPYYQHVVAVAMILDRLGFGEDVVIAGLLHEKQKDLTKRKKAERKRIVVSEI